MQRWFVAFAALLLPLLIQGCYPTTSVRPDTSKMSDSEKQLRKAKADD